MRPDELPRLFAAIDADLNTTAHDFIWLSVLTGARKANVLAMRWSEIDWDSRTWHIADTKKAWQRVLERAEINDLRIHDIRRTLGSYHAIAGESLSVIGKSQGHKSQRATEAYARLHLDPVRASIVSAT